VIADGRIPVEIREHLLHLCHHRLDPHGDVEHLHAAHVLRQRARHFLDRLVARVGDRVDGVAEADDDLLGLDAPADVRLGLGG
jgi:hypothetical protein